MQVPRKVFLLAKCECVAYPWMYFNTFRCAMACTPKYSQNIFKYDERIKRHVGSDVEFAWMKLKKQMAVLKRILTVSGYNYFYFDVTQQTQNIYTKTTGIQIKFVLDFFLH